MAEDTQEPEISESGLWFDSIDKKVVDAPPVEGVQIVPPGGELTPAVKVQIELSNQAEGIFPQYAPADEPGSHEKADEPEVANDEPDPEPKKAPAKKAPARKAK